MNGRIPHTVLSFCGRSGRRTWRPQRSFEQTSKGGAQGDGGDGWKQANVVSTGGSSTNASSPHGITDSNASFLLGMDLFGQDVSVLERAIQDKLEDVEEDLRKIIDSTRR